MALKYRARLSGRPQTIQRDRDEPANRSLGRQVARRGHRVQAVARKLTGRDIVPDVTARCAFRQEVSNELSQFLLCSGNVLTTMQQRRELRFVPLVRDERECLEHSLEPLARIIRLITHFGEMLEVRRDVAFVPRDQDGLDV